MGRPGQGTRHIQTQSNFKSIGAAWPEPNTAVKVKSKLVIQSIGLGRAKSGFLPIIWIKCIKLHIPTHQSGEVRLSAFYHLIQVRPKLFNKARPKDGLAWIEIYPCHNFLEVMAKLYSYVIPTIQPVIHIIYNVLWKLCNGKIFEDKKLINSRSYPYA